MPIDTIFVTYIQFLLHCVNTKSKTLKSRPRQQLKAEVILNVRPRRTEAENEGSRVQTKDET